MLPRPLSESRPTGVAVLTIRCALFLLAAAPAFATVCRSSASSPPAKADAPSAKPGATSANSDAPAAGAPAFRERTEVYKTVGEVQLVMTIREPAGHKAGDKRPAVVFFFGGGWTSGSPAQFVHQCRYLAGRGIVAMAADYRVRSRHPVKVADCVSDAKSAIRWARTNAAKLGIDPDRIAAAGGSAGGHLAAATATLPDFDAPGEDVKVACRPDALLLFNPALDLRPEAFGKTKSPAGDVARLGAEAEKLSPTAHVRKGMPPAIVFHGKADTTVPFAQAEAFAKAVTDAGGRCDVAGYDGQPHGFFNHGRGDNKHFAATLTRADEFLTGLGWLTGKPSVEAYLAGVKPQPRPGK